MTAFVASNGLINNFDAYTTGSINATLDTYTISAGSTLRVRTDTYACVNHSVAFGSLDTVSFTGQGGTLNFDPTYVRVVAYTAGSGLSPAYGATISQGAVSGVFLGAWTNWLSEPIVPGVAIGATGFIKIGGVTGGSFAAGALTGITATCSGADVQGWIEVRGPDLATITVPRVGAVTSVEAWFQIGTTNGVRGQTIECPTTATAAGVFAGVWIETAVASGVYEPYTGAGSQLAIATTRTDATTKFVWQTTTGIRIGNDGVNAVGWLPVTGLRVRIPAIIWTNCTRTVSGSGPRVLPNATIATRQEFVTTGAGYFDLRGIVSQWYMNFSQAFYVKYKSCAISDAMILSEIAAPLDVSDCIVSPTQAQSAASVLQIVSCFAGGTVQGNRFWRFSLPAANAYISTISYATGVTFSNNVHGSLTLRLSSTIGAIAGTQTVNCTFNNETFIGGRAFMVTSQNCNFNNTTYYDHTLTTTTSATNPTQVFEFGSGAANNTVTGLLLPLPAVGPYNVLVFLSNCYNTTVKEIGTFAAPLALDALVTGYGLQSTGNNDGVKFKRCYMSNTRISPWAFQNSDSNVLIENVNGDYADTGASLISLNTIVKGCGLTSTTAGQVSVYGSHWQTRFISLTAGFAEITCNEPTVASASQCVVTGGVPQFNSSGQLLLTKVGDQVTWEMPFFAIGFTAFTNVAPTVTGTNAVFTSGSAWGSHTIEYQIDTGAGFGAWLAFNSANLITHTITAATGFKLKIRATTLTVNAANSLTNIRVAMTTTSVAQSANLYPLSVNTVTFTGLPTGCDAVVLAAGTTTTLDLRDSLVGTSYGYTYAGAQTVDIGFIKIGYVPFYIRGLSLVAADSSIPVSMTQDRNFI